MQISTERTRSVLLAVIALVPLWGMVGATQSAAAAALEDSEKLARQLSDWGGIHRGLCVVLWPDGGVALELVRTSELFVHVRDPHADAVAVLRQRADEAGFGIGRLAVEQGGHHPLPYADNMVDLLISFQTDAESPDGPAASEVLRVLRPQGVALVGTAHAEDQGRVEALGAWAAADDTVHVEALENSLGSWLRLEKPPADGADDWSHWEKSPDNNPVSTDRLIKAPYMTQFLATPFYIGMPSVTTSAGGRTFLAIGHIAHHRREWTSLNKLIARNGYNGTVLWERKLPQGYLVHRSAFVATPDTFFMMEGDRCLALDARTGQQQAEIRIPGFDGEWKWMCMQDGVLYALAGEPGPGAETVKGDRTYGGWSWADLSQGYYGKRIKFALGDTLVAYDLQQEELIWKHQEETLIDARGMALRDNRMYVYCPDRHLRCLIADTGEVLWTNDVPEVMELIAQPGKGLRSTPGFRTACMAVATPRALIVQGQTRMNVVALSADSGSLLWTKQKITNNPNAIYVDDDVVLGVGPGGSHVAINPLTGEVKEDLKFLKRACTRLTASTDSFFCRGEGLMRFDRQTKKILIDGAARPACNDGALPANGMLYLGPWQCDCNLSLIGRVAKCSAGEFDFDVLATEDDRLSLHVDDVSAVAPLPVSDEDWPTFRSDNHRSAGTSARVATPVTHRWQYTPNQQHVPTAATAAGDLIFVAGQDGKVRALESIGGEVRWEFATASPIKYPPTIWEGRAYFGCGDGYVYALEAATGRVLWRFRAAPVERQIMVYGSLSSTWPVNSGVLVRDGIAYFAAGIIDYDGTYVYALDAATGKIVWQNNSAGHLNPELRKGVSVQGNLTVQGDRLLLAGGNQVSPAPFDLATGQCLAEPFDQGQPKANNGKFVGVFQDQTVIAGGRILYSAPANVSTKGKFAVFSDGQSYGLNYGSLPPAWDADTFALVNHKNGRLVCCDAGAVAAQIEEGFTQPEQRGNKYLARTLQTSDAMRWQTDLDKPNKFEVISLAICPETIVAVLQFQRKTRSQPEWQAVAFGASDGSVHFQYALRDVPLPGGLLVDRHGQVIVCMLNGDVLCLGSDAP